MAAVMRSNQKWQPSSTGKSREGRNRLQRCDEVSEPQRATNAASVRILWTFEGRVREVATARAAKPPKNGLINSGKKSLLSGARHKALPL